MIQKTLLIQNKLGLHARASMKLSDLAARYASQVTIKSGSQEINVKDIMDIMGLAASQGHEIDVYIEGEDEQQAMEAIEQLIDDKFGEGE